MKSKKFILILGINLKDGDFMSTKFEWWGYRHVSGTLQAKRYFDPRDMQDARESPFCEKVVGPFLASDRDEALDTVKTLTE